MQGEALARWEEILRGWQKPERDSGFTNRRGAEDMAGDYIAARIYLRLYIG